MELWCYADKKEKICLEFHPCINTGENISWEEWHTSDPLFIYATDYDMLLPYFKRVFPLINPTNDETQETFDICFSNWIGRDDWQRIIEHMKSNIPTKENEAIFFNQFLGWLKAQLSWVVFHK